MNICFINYDYSIKGGAQRVTYNLINEFTTTCRISLISIFSKNEMPSYDVSGLAEYHILVDKKSSFYKHAAYILLKTREYLKKNKVDILIAAGMPSAMVSSISSYKLPCKLIVCEHSSIYNTVYSNFVMKINRLFAAYSCSQLVVLTESCKQGYIEKYKISPEKIVVIPNWIEKKTYTNKNYRPCNKKIITVGRADPVKGFDTLIRVAQIVRPHLNDWEWHVWGDFSNNYGKKIIEQSISFGLEDFLFFKGQINNLYEKYSDYSIYVMTSLFEGLPMALLEAKANKLPIIAFNCMTGPGEIVQDNLDGFLIPPGDMQKMADTIVSLANNQLELEKFSNNTSKNLSKFSLETIKKQWEELFETIL